MNVFKKLFYLLSHSERKRAGLVLCMILIMTVFDTLGVASIMPFMAVLSNPQLLETNKILSALFIACRPFGVATPKEFLLVLGLLVFLLLVISLTFKALTTYAQTRFALMREYSIGKRLVEGYLYQPYSWFLSRNSSDLGKSILSEVNQVIYYAVMPSMSLIANTAVAIGLLSLLILVDPRLALTVGLVLGAAYGLIFLVSSNFLTRAGNVSIEANQARFIAVNEAFGGIKEVKVGGLERFYIGRFVEPAQIYARQQTIVQVVTQLPRFALEAIGFGGMLLVMLYLFAQGGDFATALPVIALYAFAGYRLMPALQHIYGAAAQLRFARPALDSLHQDLISLQFKSQNNDTRTITYAKEISLNNVYFSYPGSSGPTLKGITLNIPEKSIVGFVGSTGSGKTTMVDVILGLLEAQQGTLKVDGKEIDDSNRSSWQGAIGYVPQQIYLEDGTIASNIAFGIKPQDIDQEAVERAAKIANLHEFVIRLPNQYHTRVGERGVRLSGGQRQRIGIARALYHDPRVLILDEATSALDTLTEQAVIEALQKLRYDITMIVIAHRLSTVRECDIIFVLEKGEIKECGSFDELAKNNKSFSAMLSGGDMSADKTK